jgi:hypothetical protein
MRYPGITVDVEKIAVGMYAMIKEHPDGVCLRYGMFPAVLMECLENSLKGKIPDSYLDRETLEAVNGKHLRQEIEHDVCCQILTLASDEGYCIV